MVGNGIEIGSHSMTHPKMFHDITLGLSAKNRGYFDHRVNESILNEHLGEVRDQTRILWGVSHCSVLAPDLHRSTTCYGVL
jgi:hypothetical protein